MPLPADREDDLEGHVASGIEDTPTSGSMVDVGVLQTAQVALVGSVEQVVANDVYLAELPLAVEQDVGTQCGAEQRVGGRGRLGVVGHVVVVLPEVVADAQADKGIVEKMVYAMVVRLLAQVVAALCMVVSIVEKFPFHFPREPVGRCEWEVTSLPGLVQLASIHHREG